MQRARCFQTAECVSGAAMREGLFAPLGDKGMPDALLHMGNGRCLVQHGNALHLYGFCAAACCVGCAAEQLADTRLAGMLMRQPWTWGSCLGAG